DLVGIAATVFGQVFCERFAQRALAETAIDHRFALEILWQEELVAGKHAGMPVTIGQHQPAAAVLADLGDPALELAIATGPVAIVDQGGGNRDWLAQRHRLAVQLRIGGITGNGNSGAEREQERRTDQGTLHGVFSSQVGWAQRRPCHAFYGSRDAVLAAERTRHAACGHNHRLATTTAMTPYVHAIDPIALDIGPL